MAIVALDHVQIAAPDGCEPQARAFYGELLGLAEVPKPASLAGRGGVWFRIGDQQLHVGVERRFSPARRAHPALRVASSAALRALAGALEEHGVEVAWDAELPGHRALLGPRPLGQPTRAAGAG